MPLHSYITDHQSWKRFSLARAGKFTVVELDRGLFLQLRFLVLRKNGLLSMQQSWNEDGEFWGLRVEVY